MEKEPAVLRTVDVPSAFAKPFESAQEYVRRYFSQRIEDPQHATISISGERYVLVRAASMSVEFFDLVTSLYRDCGDEEARRVANNILFDLAHSIGKGDARSFHARMNLTDPIDRLSAGPIHFSFAGWAFVRILPESKPSPDENYFLIYDHPFSFESDSWLRRARKVDFPVCIMNAGYSSGWCEESFGLPLVAAEFQCVAKGDATCRFIMAPPSRIEEHLARYVGADQNANISRSEIRKSVAVPEFFQRKRMEDELRQSHALLEKRVLERTRELEQANASLQAEIAERKRAEEASRELEEQVRQAVKLEAVGKLAGGIAHDFNNLLTIIGHSVEMLKTTSGLDLTALELIEGIRLAGDRAAQLTRQLLAFSRKQILAPKVLDLNHCVTEVELMLRRLIGDDVELITLLDPTLKPVKADPGQISQVIMNIAVNARDAMPEGGLLRVETHNVQLSADLAPDVKPGAYALLSISDSGMGMDAETKDRIFEPFFTTKEFGRGSGLGLAMVYGIVKQSGGHIIVESTIGTGTVFRIYLPQTESAADQQAAGKQSASASKENVGTVLLVEDEPSVRMMTRLIVQRIGYRVLEAADGPQALRFLEKFDGPIDLLFTDISMPHMSGFELANQIRALRPNLKILFTSGHSNTQLPGDPLAIKSAYLQKPYSVPDLQSTLKRLLAE